MNRIAHLTPHENMFQILSQSVKPFNLEVGEFNLKTTYFIGEYFGEDRIP